eukprot:GEMP01061115.1.p1 GENE.GEMP01061115.1~~GEMP01061115.1.p1  ORF type:complete len:392 (-),score=82.48 GEMP01061115.1:67-1242(-)
MFGSITNIFQIANLTLAPRRLSEKNRPSQLTSIGTENNVPPNKVSRATTPEDLRRRTTIGYGTLPKDLLKPTTATRDAEPKPVDTVETPNPRGDAVTATEKPSAEKKIDGTKARRTTAKRASQGFKLLYLGRDSTNDRNSTWGGNNETGWENYEYPSSDMMHHYYADYYYDCQGYQGSQPADVERFPISLELSLGLVQEDPRRSVTEKADLGDATTIMLRNIPNRYTQEMLFDEFRANGILNSIDFFYLPMDVETRCNMGYCFLNLVSETAVEKFVNMFHNIKLDQISSGKICQVSRAKVQGKDANIEQYRNSAVINNMDENFHPILLENGERLPFPAPTKSQEELRAQRSESQRASSRYVSQMNGNTDSAWYSNGQQKRQSRGSRFSRAE